MCLMNFKVISSVYELELTLEPVVSLQISQDGELMQWLQKNKFSTHTVTRVFSCVTGSQDNTPVVDTRASGDAQTCQLHVGELLGAESNQDNKVCLGVMGSTVQLNFPQLHELNLNAGDPRGPQGGHIPLNITWTFLAPESQCDWEKQLPVLVLLPPEKSPFAGMQLNGRLELEIKEHAYISENIAVYSQAPERSKLLGFLSSLTGVFR